MAKTWVLDTDTKGTGARMVPIEDASKGAEPKAPFVAQPPKAGAPKARSAQKKPERKLLTPLGPGQVRKKSTGEIGKVKAVDAKAGTAAVTWLRSGQTSTVSLSSITRR